MPNGDDNDWHTELRLSTASSSYNCEQENNPESLRLLAEEGDENEMPQVELDGRHYPAARMFLIRTLALLCACSLSIGSHYILLTFQVHLTYLDLLNPDSHEKWVLPMLNLVC